MMMAKWFPLGIAHGNAFCNRINEQKLLLNNIKSVVHTLIMSPRRYGKTSLARKVVGDSNLKYCTMDFNLVTDMLSAQEIIYECVADLLSDVLPSYKKAIPILKKYFSKLETSIKIDTHMGLKIELGSGKTRPQIEIYNVLQGLEKAARDANKKVIVFMDEFQQIATIENSELLEAAIRNAAQESEYVSYIFSGSNRHLLELMFEDSNRPLFHLCDKMKLERIAETDYVPYLVKVAKARWKKSIDKKVAENIFRLTVRHPYYMNLLCARLWQADNLPDAKTVEKVWKKYVDEEIPRMSNDINSLSNHQKKLLLLIAKRMIKQPTSKEVTIELKISMPSAAQSCKVLLQRDFIYQDDEGYYRILDPAIEYYLRSR